MQCDAMMTATKFEPGTKLSPSVVPSSMPSSLGHSSSSSSSSSSSVSISSTFPQNASPYYCWPVGAEWSLAAAAMSRSAGLCAADPNNQLGALCTPSQAYYGQMAAAVSSVSASSTSLPGGSAWYSPTNNCGDYYDGLQRVAGHTLNGYLGSTYGSGNAYPSPVASAYYGTSFPAASHYAAAALSASSAFDVKKADPSYLPMMAAYSGGGQPQQQQYNNLAGTMQPQQSTSAELDTSALIVGGAAPNQQNGANNVRTATTYQQQQQQYSPHSSARKATASGGNLFGAQPAKKSGKSEHKTASKRSKKKKAHAAAAGGTRVSPMEPNNTALVFVWELEDLCTVVPTATPCRDDWEGLSTLERLLRYGFQLESQEECEQTNVEDAASDEALQNAQNYALSNGGEQMADEMVTTNSAEGEKGKRIENGGQLSPQRHQQPKQEMLLQGMPMNSSNPSATTTARPSPNNNNTNDGLRKLAAKYRLIRNMYEHFRGPRLEEWLQQCIGIRPDAYRSSYEHSPFYNKMELFRQCLRVVSERSRHTPNRCTNVVWSSMGNVGVAGALGQLMLCRMSEFVPAENVYCTAKMGREAVLERLANHFQKKHITMISSKEETQLFAKKEGIPCWPLRFEECILKFRYALDILLGDIDNTVPPLAADALMQRTLPNGRFGGDEETGRTSGGGTMALGGGGTAGGMANGTGAFLTVRG